MFFPKCPHIHICSDQHFLLIFNNCHIWFLFSIRRCCVAFSEKLLHLYLNVQWKISLAALYAKLTWQPNVYNVLFASLLCRCGRKCLLKRYSWPSASLGSTSVDSTNHRSMVLGKKKSGSSKTNFLHAGHYG